MSVIRVGDVGTALVVTVKDETGAIVDISAALDKQIYLTMPNGSILNFTAELDTGGGVDGKMRYITRGVAFDLMMRSGVRDWQIEGWVKLATGKEWTVDPSPFTVGKSDRYPDL